MHAPVENTVLVATARNESSPGNPFAVPAMARAAGAGAGPVAAAPAATTTRPGKGRGSTMARWYMGWTVVALVLGVGVFGLPAWFLARRARADEQAGNLERATRRSYLARSVAAVTVVCMVFVWMAVISDATGS